MTSKAVVEVPFISLGIGLGLNSAKQRVLQLPDCFSFIVQLEKTPQSREEIVLHVPTDLKDVGPSKAPPVGGVAYS